LPEVPTLIESGLPGFEAGSWFGFFAPKGTPEPIIAELNRTVNEILALPSIEKQMIGQGADPIGGTPGEFGQFVQREYEKWKVVVRESGATAD
jgi:tripartite-type tricarboxylate transporter receptor subunit TctC